ncbi:unnamed protein product [Rhizophagus irregularis]|uniref:Uncharacterized protein n=1 Tax=Rhizophagus irregularis TaxID=588596 RepID=A0A915YS76_9GLOM|nr:unnamed protein product [Rhizophagus irregularis]
MPFQFNAGIQSSQSVESFNNLKQVGLLHLSFQFFSDVDTVIVEFLIPLILSLQRFQISQSFTYEGQLISYSFDNSPFDTPNDNFIENIVDELQVILKAILNDMDTSNIVKT